MSGQPDLVPVDLLAVQANDELLDLLAARIAWGVADPAVALLRALTEDVDEGLEALLAAAAADEALVSPVSPIPSMRWAPSDFPTSSPAPDVLPDVLPAPAPARRRTVRGLAVGLAVAGTLSFSGVAAAVTGDPLAAYHAVMSLGDGDRPPTRAELAGLRAQLADAHAAVRGGHLPAARAGVARLREQLADYDLGPAQRVRLERDLHALEASLARATALEVPPAGGPDGALHPGIGPGGVPQSTDAPGAVPSTQPDKNGKDDKNGMPGASSKPAPTSAVERPRADQPYTPQKARPTPDTTTTPSHATPPRSTEPSAGVVPPPPEKKPGPSAPAVPSTPVPGPSSNPGPAAPNAPPTTAPKDKKLDKPELGHSAPAQTGPGQTGSA